MKKITKTVSLTGAMSLKTRVVKSKDSTLLNSQNVILYGFYKAKKYLPGTVESPFYEVIIVTYSFL